MRVPEPIQAIFRQIVGVGPIQPRPPPGAPAAARPEPVPAGNARRGPLPEVTYQQEVDRRRRQERLDADLARRLQLASLIGPDDDNNLPQEPLGLGNVAGHFMNNDFVQNAANVVMNAFGDPDLGRRGERAPGRRRRSRQVEQIDHDHGLVPDFLGDPSVVDNTPRRPERQPRRNPAV